VAAGLLTRLKDQFAGNRSQVPLGQD
jgi:hypothetical protein